MSEYTHFAAVVLCSHPNSKRIPRKVFKPIAGRPALWHILKRMETWKYPFLLAVPFLSTNEYDDIIKEFPYVTLCYGNAESPLHRMKDVLDDLKIKPKWIVRITHDDILIDISTVEELLSECDMKIGCGYGVSPAIVDGAGVEVFRYENLQAAYSNRKAPTEFISYFVKSYPYSVTYKHTPRKSINRNYRLTMDYPEDTVVLDMVLSRVGPEASLDKIVEYLDRRPYILNINKLPDVSIYTCAHNSERWVDETVTSVLFTDSRVDFEYIFIDDRSEDNTPIEAAKYSNDKRIRYFINETNLGLSSSCNRALELSKGRYIMRVDSDDFIAPHAIEIMKKKMEEDQSGLVYAAYKETNKDGEIASEKIAPDLYHHAGCALMDKRMLNEIRFTTGLRNWDSLDIYNRMKGVIPISYYNEDALWYYRRGHQSLSQTGSAQRERDFDLINNSGDINISASV